MTTIKHNLKYDGSAYKADGTLLDPDSNSTAGTGHALCTCGWMSDELPSGGQRRKAHKAHKAEVAAEDHEQEVLEDQASHEENLLEDAADDSDQDVADDSDQDVADDSGQDVADDSDQDLQTSLQQAQDQADSIAQRVEEALEQDDDATYVKLGWATRVAKHFWAPLGKKGAAALVKTHFPDVEVLLDDSRRIVSISGAEQDVRDAAEMVLALYSPAGADLKTWKKSHPEYSALDHTTTDGRRRSYVLTNDFWAEYVAAFENLYFTEELI